MLEGLVAWVLNTYCGQYLEDLNTDQLSIGLLKGELELEDVPLRKDALRHLDIPLQVVSGFVGRVKIQIPVTRLRSEPWVVVLEHLYGVVAPIELDKYNKDAAEEACFLRKLSQLDTLEASWRADQAAKAGEPYAAAATSWFSFGTSFLTNIIENIQLQIHDVHLRFEDTQSIPGQVFACGLTVRALAVHSTDSNWIPTFVQNVGTSEDAVSHKVLELTELAFYWDTRSQCCSQLSLPELKDWFSDQSGHEHIVEPVSAMACLRRHLTPSPLKSRTTPRLSCHLTMPTFPVHLTDEQYSQMVQTTRLYDRLDKAKHYCQLRPVGLVKDNATDWWQYAMQCHLDNIHAKYVNANWDFVLERSSDLVKYVDAYTQQLLQPNTVLISNKQIMNKLEQVLGFSELKALREVAMRRVEELTPKHSPVHTFVQNVGTSEDAVSHKVLELTELAFYWDTRSQCCSQLSLPELKVNSGVIPHVSRAVILYLRVASSF
ncbi:Vacuolar protein sorting-associated protein 13 N-terminal domain [Trinorchestia longiramus]|nr:Vacuolar protein sorting-associated protein 13 N-terminal domain [Trinorchestia longiramus]